MSKKVAPGAKRNSLHCESMAECLTEKRMFHSCEVRTVASSSEAERSNLAWFYYPFSLSFVHLIFFFLAVALQKRFECTLWRHF